MTSQRTAQLIVATVFLVTAKSFRLPEEKLNREERQAAFLGSGGNLGAGLGFGTQTVNVDGQNLTIAGSYSGMSGGLSVESNELLGLNPNITSQLVRQILDMFNNQTLFLGGRKKRQAFQFGMPTNGIVGQNMLGLFSNEAFSGGMSGPIVVDANGTLSMIGPMFPGNYGGLLLGDRKKRQVTLGQLPNINMNGQNILGLFSNEGFSGGMSGPIAVDANGTLSMIGPMFPGNYGGLLLGDRKKRQVTLGQIPNMNMNGQNIGFGLFSNEAFSGGMSGPFAVDVNGTLSRFGPMLSGNYGGFLLGDRKKRQAILGQANLQVPTYTLDIGGQNVTVAAGGFSGLSLEASQGSGELFMNTNGTLSYLRPGLSAFGLNNPALPGLNNPVNWLLGDRKKRQATIPQIPFQLPTFTLDIGGQNVTVAGGFSGLSLEASLGSGELFMNTNGTLSYLRPGLSAFGLNNFGLNNAALPGLNNPVNWLLGDRKKRQATIPQTPFQLPTFTLDIGGQNVTVAAGGFSGLSLEASLGSGELFVNSNGTLSYLRPGLSAFGLNNFGLNNPALPGLNNPVNWLLGDRKKRQATIPQTPFQIPTFTLDIGGQNVTVAAGGFSGLSLEASLGSGELFMNTNGTLSYLRPGLSAFGLNNFGLNNAALPGLNNPVNWLLGDRKKRQATIPQTPFQLPTFTLDIGGQNVTLAAGGFSGLSLEASLGSGQLFMNTNGTLSYLRPGLSAFGLNNFGLYNPALPGLNNPVNWLLGDRKKRQATDPQAPLEMPAITPEDLVLTAAAVDVQGRTLFPGTDGDDGMAFGFGGGDTDGAVDDNMCVCSSELCASWINFIQTCRQIQSSSECVSALDQLIIIECPESY